MKREFIAVIIMFGLMSPALMASGAAPAKPAAANSAAPQSPPPNPSQSKGWTQAQSSAPQQDPVNKKSYERETRTRRHDGMSKKQKVFLVAVVGTSMSIGAIAGGGEGLAIGAIVGGWSAYVVHRLWDHIH